MTTKQIIEANQPLSTFGYSPMGQRQSKTIADSTYYYIYGDVRQEIQKEIQKEEL